MPTFNPKKYTVFVCRMEGAGRCGSKGSEQVLQEFRRQVQKRGLDNVLITTMGCTNRHELGPIVVVYPEETWYCGVTARKVSKILDGHISKGRIVEEFKHPQQRYAYPGL